MYSDDRFWWPQALPVFSGLQSHTSTLSWLSTTATLVGSAPKPGPARPFMEFIHVLHMTGRTHRAESHILPASHRQPAKGRPRASSDLLTENGGSLRGSPRSRRCVGVHDSGISGDLSQGRRHNDGADGRLHAAQVTIWHVRSFAATLLPLDSVLS